MGYRSRSLDTVLTNLAEEMLSGNLRLHKVEERFMRLYGTENPNLCFTGAAEARRRYVERFMEEKYGIRDKLNELRRTSWKVPPWPTTVDKKDEGRIASLLAQYIGGDGISIVGPFELDVYVIGSVGLDGPTIDNYPMDSLVPLAPCRPDIERGVSHGNDMIKRLKDYVNQENGETHRIKTKVSRVSRVTRSPTLKFESEEDAQKARQIISETYDTIEKEGNGRMSEYKGRLGEITLTIKPLNGHYELSANFIYHMEGDYLGHEAATKYTGSLLKKIIQPRLDSLGIPYETLWIAGGEDGDLKASTTNIRGRSVSAEIFLPKEYLLAELVNEKVRIGPTPRKLEHMSLSKHWGWTEDTQSKTGMEPEILASIFTAVRSPSPPIVSSAMRVTVNEVYEPRHGANYRVETNNLEWGIEGVRTPLRGDTEKTIGINGCSDGSNSIRFAATTMASCLAGGLNQHWLAYTHNLDSTKRHVK